MVFKKILKTYHAIRQKHRLNISIKSLINKPVKKPFQPSYNLVYERAHKITLKTLAHKSAPKNGPHVTSSSASSHTYINQPSIHTSRALQKQSVSRLMANKIVDITVSCK